MIIAEISVVPIGTGSPYVSKYVAKVVKEIESTGVKTRLNPMGTVMESESMEEILSAVGKAHECLFEEGVERVVTTLKVDERRDEKGSMEQKVKSVEEKI